MTGSLRKSSYGEEEKSGRAFETQLEKCLSNLADMETQNFRQLHRMSKILFVLTMALCVAAVTGLALVVLRLCG